MQIEQQAFPDNLLDLLLHGICAFAKGSIYDKDELQDISNVHHRLFVGIGIGTGSIPQSLRVFCLSKSHFFVSPVLIRYRLQRWCGLLDSYK